MIEPLTETDAPHDAGDAFVGARERIVSAAIRVLHVRAFHAVTLEAVAAEAGLGRAEVTEHFASLDDLVLETMTLWNGRRLEPILLVADRLGAVAFLRSVIVANVADPALMRLLTAMANVAATPGHPMAPVLQQQWNRFHAVVQRALAQDIALGREPAIEPAHGTEQLIAVYEGLQLQSMLRPNMDVVASYERAVARLRDGWSRAGDAAVWTI